jgi:formamidopyrimidine-DNA glycosylase
MTGQLVYRTKNHLNEPVEFKGGHPQKIYEQPLPHKHTHIIFTFNDNSILYFNDLRKFGWVKVVTADEANNLLYKDKYGPEPLSEQFTEKYLGEIFTKSSKAIKLVIMDQEKISGLGNIYANDALYVAGIMPNRSAKSLTSSEINKLKKAVEKVIALGIEYGGSSENTYVNVEGKKGKYMEHTATYQQKTDPKGHPLLKTKIGGRGTFYCEICQK